MCNVHEKNSFVIVIKYKNKNNHGNINIFDEKLLSLSQNCCMKGKENQTLSLVYQLKTYFQNGVIIICHTIIKLPDVSNYRNNVSKKLCCYKLRSVVFNNPLQWLK